MHQNSSIIRTLDHKLIVAVAVTELTVQGEAKSVDMIWQPSLDETIETIGRLGRGRCNARPEQRVDPTHGVDMMTDELEFIRRK
jgi:hypothetical protein